MYDLTKFYEVNYVWGNTYIELTSDFFLALSSNKDYLNWKYMTPLPPLPKVCECVRLDRMFKFPDKLRYLDLSLWDTSGVISMNSMFKSCIFIEHLDLSNFDVSNVEDMEDMFSGCGSLESLNVSGWNASKTRNINNMFKGCYELKDIEYSGLIKPVYTEHDLNDPANAKEIVDNLGIEVLEKWYASLGFDMDEIKGDPLEYIKWCERIGL